MIIKRNVFSAVMALSLVAGCGDGNVYPGCEHVEGRERTLFASEVLVSELQRMSKSGGGWGKISNGFRLTDEEIQNLSPSDFAPLPESDVIMDPGGYSEEFEYETKDARWHFSVAFFTGCSVNVSWSAFPVEW